MIDAIFSACAESSSKKTTKGSILGDSTDDPVTYFPSEVVFRIFSLVPEYDLLRLFARGGEASLPILTYGNRKSL